MSNLNELVDKLSALTVIEAAELSKLLEEKWGVSAAAAEEKTDFTLVLVDGGANKINAIKEVRAITGLGLKEAKDLVEGAPKTVKEGLNKEDAEKFKKLLVDAGAKVELK